MPPPLAFPDLKHEVRYAAFLGWHARHLALYMEWFLLATWAIGLLTVPTRCSWDASRFSCAVICVAVGAVVALHAGVTAAACCRPRLLASEAFKARVYIANLCVGMTYVMMQREPNELPGGNHAAAMAVHGWWPLLASFRLSTSVVLHGLNHLAYLLCELNLAVNVAPGRVFTLANALTYAGVSLGATALPLALHTLLEVASRDKFLAVAGMRERKVRAQSGRLAQNARRVAAAAAELRARLLGAAAPGAAPRGQPQQPAPPMTRGALAVCHDQPSSSRARG